MEERAVLTFSAKAFGAVEQLFAFFDNYRVGFEAATVRFDGDVAILTVATMMGADTIEQIEAAYDQIHAAGSKALIIDLRGNSGGTKSVLFTLFPYFMAPAAPMTSSASVS